jgi:hypothetical protein
MAKNRQHFARQFGRGATTFKCQVCERMTRDTGQGVDHLCEQCYEIAGWDNTVNDNGYQPGSPEFAQYRAICETELAKAVKLGSNGEAIKKANDYIWCLASDFEPVEPAGLTEAFVLGDGAWRVIVDGVVVPAEFNSKGAAEAAIPVERERRQRKARKVAS